MITYPISFYYTRKKEQDKQGVHRLFGAPRIRNPLLPYPNTFGNKANRSSSVSGARCGIIGGALGGVTKTHPL